MTNERASVVVTTRVFTRRARTHGDAVLNIGIKKRGCPAERHEVYWCDSDSPIARLFIAAVKSRINTGRHRVARPVPVSGASINHAQSTMFDNLSEIIIRPRWRRRR